MSFSVLFGEDVDREFLEKLDYVDEACYEPKYQGELDKTVVRWEKNPRQFVFVMDDATGNMAGYINFFPCEEGLYQDNLSRCPIIRDDDITPEEVAPWRKDANHVFVLSLAVHPHYQGGQVIRLLSDNWIAYMNRLEGQGYPITDIMGTAVSGHGRHALQNYLFRQLRHLTDGNTVYICDGTRLDNLLAHKLYFKTYKNDVYLLMPLVEHEANLRVANLLADAEAGTWKPVGASPEECEITARLMDDLQEMIAYECSNEVVQDLSLVHLGSFDFLHTTDDYEGLEEGADEVVIGCARGHAVLAAHPKTHMCVLTVVLPGYPFSVTQMEDQVSYGYVKVRDPRLPSGWGVAAAASGAASAGAASAGAAPDAASDASSGAASAAASSNASTAGTVPSDGVLGSAFPTSSPGCGEGFISLYEYLRTTFGLHGCGQAKCVLYLSDKPVIPGELQDMLAAEAFDNYDREYGIDSPEIAQMAATNRAQFNDYEVYLSSRAIVYVTRNWSDDAGERLDDFADYLFLVMMTLFQNTALAKVNIRVTRILEGASDIAPRTKLAIDREYGRTIRFWEMQNFKYLSTQLEAEAVKEAFGNAELRATYDEHQAYLEHLVSTKAAITEARNGMIINVVAVILAIIQLQPFFVELLQVVYNWLGLEAAFAPVTINYGMFGGVALLVLVLIINNRRQRFVQKNRL